MNEAQKLPQNPVLPLCGRVALVTGAARGIGRAIAERLAADGADVVVAGRDAATCEETAAVIRAAGRRAEVVQMDVADGASVDAGVTMALERFGRIDICVNNAGVTRDTLIVRMTEQDWDAVLDTNLKGAFLVSKAVARPMMRQRAGAIVNISSVVGLTGNAGQCNYAASKAGLIAFTKSLARELAARGIRVNAVAPGFVETRMTESLPEEVRKAALEQIPLRRLGRPEDIADAVAFLVSDAASYVTGQTLSVNGGLAMV